MPIETSMYANLQAPDIMGGVERGMRMRDMMDQRAERQAALQKEKDIQAAYAAGVNPDGSINPQATMSQLSGKGLGREAQAFSHESMMREDEKQRMTMNRRLREVELVARLLPEVNDQASWDRALDTASKAGADTSQMLKTYDPQFKQMLYGQALSVKDQIEQRMAERQFEANQMNKDRSYDLEKRELALKSQPAAGKTPQMTIGQKEVDRKFAPDYNEWTSGGAQTARTEIDKLQGVVNGLKTGSVSTGGLTGILPDRLTSNKVLGARADVQSTVMNSLRAILGAQFTEKEGERIIKNTWNESDSTANNVARLERLVGDLRAKAQSKEEKAKYFERVGSLTGYQAGKPSPKAQAADGANVSDDLRAAAKAELERRQRARQQAITNRGGGSGS